MAMNMEKRDFKWKILFFLLCFWQLPQMLVALIMVPFLGKLELIASRHFNFCFKGEKMKGGISLGMLCFVSESLSHDKESVAHELDGHTKDSLIFGPLYLVFIGIPSILWAALYNPMKRCYYSFYTERWANKHAKLIVTDDCDLMFEND